MTVRNLDRRPASKRLTERTIVLDRGRIVHEGPSTALLADAKGQARLLGVDAGRDLELPT